RIERRSNGQDQPPLEGGPRRARRVPEDAMRLHSSPAAVALALFTALAAAPRVGSAEGDAADAASEGPLRPGPVKDRTKAPSASEWASAPRVKPTRRGAAGAGCRVYLLRDWIRVRCAVETFALSLLGGEADVAFWIDPATREGEVQMPVRP